MKYKGLSAAVYTDTTNVEHEVNGLLTYDHAVEKMDAKGVNEINRAVITEGKKLNSSGVH
jgi:hypothetical protein